MKTETIRDKFIKYFENKGHTVVPSSTLVPRNDPSLLFSNAGMNQFKDVFLGYDKRNYKRAVSCQKCVRAGGKHNDLENVGFTYRHHTFFEMLGNFSFGDYFKKEAIEYCWELLTKEYGIKEDSLFVTVFNDDDEAYDIWTKDIGVPKNRVSRMGEKDNFWSMGDVGPCGPCSEVFYDHGEEYSCKKKNCTVGCDCDRFVEIWNLVFMQFNRDESGKLSALPRPSIDTGAGLERLSAAIQGVASNYDIDLFVEIKKEIEKGAKNKLSDSKFNSSYNVIADHLRSIAFIISDGCMPSNEGTGYVLRRIIRRAIRHGKILGFDTPFMYKKISKVIEIMSSAYPELYNTRKEIEKILKIEEEKFFETLEKGLVLLEKEMEKLKPKGLISSSIAFKLYDTYGFPLDLTELISRERGFSVDTAGFNSEMEKQKNMARKSACFTLDKNEEKIDYKALDEKLSSRKVKSTEFLGYTEFEAEAKCLYFARTDDLSFVVFDKTPFYAESGGQLSDTGFIFDEKGVRVAEVKKVIKPIQGVYLHILESKEELKEGKSYKLTIDVKRRKLIQRNHTATHVLHFLLRKNIGEHAKQAGSSVSSDMFRFDFNHYEGISEDVIRKIEDDFNQIILDSVPVEVLMMDYKEAIKKGAVALFGEKYEDKVRVIKVGDYSSELCGGTHVSNTSEMGVFKIKSEFSIGSGLRRIEAITSFGAYDFMAKDTRIIETLIKETKSTREEFLDKIVKLINENKDLKKRIEKTKSGNIKSTIDSVISKSQMVEDTRVIFLKIENADMKQLRESVEYIKSKVDKAVCIMHANSDDKFIVVTSVSKSVTDKVRASEIMKFISELTGAKGGGSNDFAQGGGSFGAGFKDISSITGELNDFIFKKLEVM